MLAVHRHISVPDRIELLKTQQRFEIKAEGTSEKVALLTRVRSLSDYRAIDMMMAIVTLFSTQAILANPSEDSLFSSQSRPLALQPAAAASAAQRFGFGMRQVIPMRMCLLHILQAHTMF